MAAEKEATPTVRSRSSTPAARGSLPARRERARGRSRGRGRGRGRGQRTPSEGEEEQPEISDNEEYVPAARPQARGGGRKRVSRASPPPAQNASLTRRLCCSECQ